METKTKQNTIRTGLLSLVGFTLIEVIVVVAIISTIATGFIIAINPAKQQDKARDASRASDISEIRNALNLYYNDTKCFPTATDSVTSHFVAAYTSGGAWQEGSTVYMQKVPKDPTGVSYTYFTDAASVCPQWATVFAKLSKAQTVDSQGTTALCSLPGTGGNSCVPIAFDSSWACVTSGNTNCAQLITSSLPTPTPTASPTASLSPTPTPTPTGQPGDFTVAMNANPQFYQGTLAPLYPTLGSTANISINVADPNLVTVVTATILTDTKTNNVTFTRTGGTSIDGTWTGSWVVNDTLNNYYKITFFGTDSVGNHSSVDVVLR